MNKKLILPSIIIFFTNMMIAQEPDIQWQKSFGESSGSFNQANDIQNTSDGGYIVAGMGGSDIPGKEGYDYWIIKLNADGAIQWQKTFGGSHIDEAKSIRQTSDGGYIIAGDTYSTDGDVTGNHGGYDYWIVKLDADGNLQWQKSLGGSQYDQANDIQQTTDGGYIVAGSSWSKDGDITGNYRYSDYWIVKLNANGAIQWQRSLGGTSYDFATAIQQTSDGGYIVAGYSSSNDGDVIGNHGSSDAWIVKLNSNGFIQWQKSLGGSSGESVHSIQLTSDGSYILAGLSYSKNGDVTENHGNADYWIAKINNNGIIQWQRSLGGSKYDKANAISQTSDGGYIAAGYSASDNGDITGNVGGNDYWIVKFDADGIVKWQKSLGGIYSDQANAIQQTSDGGYIVAGYTSYDLPDHSIEGYCWIVKLYPENLNTYETTLKNTILVENPVKDLLKIHSKKKITSLHLYNVTGQLIKSSNSQNMSVNELSKGIYILKIQLENGKTISDKIIKE